MDKGIELSGGCNADCTEPGAGADADTTDATPDASAFDNVDAIDDCPSGWGLAGGSMVVTRWKSSVVLRSRDMSVRRILVVASSCESSTYGW